MRINIALLIAALTAITSSATEVESDSTRWLGDVTVTAIKQSADLSLTPGAVTVVGSRQVSGVLSR